jgi:hypothetical protein
MITADESGNAPIQGANTSVESFVALHGIEGLLRHAKEAIQRQFENVESLSLSVQNDPDDDGVEWLQIDLNVRSTPESVAAARTAFRKELARLAPGVDQSLVRLCIGVTAE